MLITNANDSQADFPAEKWGWLLVLGIVYVVLGMIALGSVVMATAATVMFVGLMMIVAGVAEMINAFRTEGWPRATLIFLLGLAYIAAGAIAFGNPLLASSVLTLLLGLSLAASGVFKLVIALRTRAVAPYGLILVSGLLTLLVGLMILVRWPTSSLYVLGLFLGFDLVVAGVSWILLGLVSRGQSRKSA